MRCMGDRLGHVCLREEAALQLGDEQACMHAGGTTAMQRRRPFMQAGPREGEGWHGAWETDLDVGTPRAGARLLSPVWLSCFGP